MALSNRTVRALRAAGLDPAATERAVAAALDEDLRYGADVTTTATVRKRTRGTAVVTARQPGVIAGLPVALAVLDASGAAGRGTAGGDVSGGDRAGGDGAGGDGAELLQADGDRIAAGTAVLRFVGPVAGLLSAERTLLNFLTHLSGIATATRAWADAVAGTGAVIRDTRKTLPGLRELEKYAVRCGGGVNHRLGLGDAALIKDNHVAAAGGITAAIEAVRAAAPGQPLEVECDTLEQVAEALAAGAAEILLDNMGLAELRGAVALARRYPATRLEASGGLRLADARAVAETGVHYLSVGALTHSSPALDLGLDLI